MRFQYFCLLFLLAGCSLLSAAERRDVVFLSSFDLSKYTDAEHLRDRFFDNLEDQLRSDFSGHPVTIERGVSVSRLVEHLRSPVGLLVYLVHGAKKGFSRALIDINGDDAMRAFEISDVAASSVAVVACHGAEVCAGIAEDFERRAIRFFAPEGIVWMSMSGWKKVLQGAKEMFLAEEWWFLARDDIDDMVDVQIEASNSTDEPTADVFVLAWGRAARLLNAVAPGKRTILQMRVPKKHRRAPRKISLVTAQSSITAKPHNFPTCGVSVNAREFELCTFRGQPIGEGTRIYQEPQP